MRKKLTTGLRKTLRPQQRPEEGMALVIALMLLSVLSSPGRLGPVDPPTWKLKFPETPGSAGRPFRRRRRRPGTAGILEDNITDVGWMDNYNYGGVTINDGDFGFEPRALDDDLDGDMENDVVNAPDLTFGSPMAGNVDVDKGPLVPVSGSSTVTATGYEGAGKGAAGGGLKQVFHFRTRACSTTGPCPCCS